MMSVEVLISCMNQADFSITEKSNIRTDALIINQTTRDEYQELHVNGNTYRMISCTQRGLSVSRNLALSNASGHICLLCDDDEVFEDDYQKTITDAFDKLKNADIIAFQIRNSSWQFGNRIGKVNRFNSFHLHSPQLAFRLSSIIQNAVTFDSNIGSGTGFGAGEENKFLIDCLKKGMKIYTYPKSIASILPGTSNWFSGYNADFFWQRGCTTRYIFGLPFSVIYGLYYILAKYKLYRKQITSFDACRFLFRGIIDNPIAKGQTLYPVQSRRDRK